MHTAHINENATMNKFFICNEASINHIIEIRSLNFNPGKRDEFHRLYIEKALPLSYAGTSM